MTQLDFLLDALHTARRDRLTSLITLRRFACGEVVSLLGEPLVAAVDCGWLKLLRLDENGNQHVVSLERSGNVIGLEAIVCPSLEPPEIVAVSSGSLMVWAPDQLLSWIHDENRTAFGVARVLAMRSEEAFRERSSAASSSLVFRLARLLSLFASERGESTACGLRVPFRVNQREIADFLGVRRESVNAKLGELEAAGLIEGRGRDLYVMQRMTDYLESEGNPESDGMVQTESEHRDSSAIPPNRSVVAQSVLSV